MLTLVLLILHADPNAEGFAEYKKGNYAKAAPLFEKAIKADAKSPWPWVNRARTLAMLAKGQDPDEYCAYEKNWVLLALDALEHAVALDKAKVLAKLGEPDPGTDALKKRPEVKAWLASASFDGDVAKLLAANPEWHSTGEAGAIVKPLTIDAKAVKVAGKQVTLADGGKYELKVQGWFFDEGKRHFSIALLEGPKTWQLGPAMADCD